MLKNIAGVYRAVKQNRAIYLYPSYGSCARLNIQLKTANKHKMREREWSIAVRKLKVTLRPNAQVHFGFVTPWTIMT